MDPSLTYCPDTFLYPQRRGRPTRTSLPSPGDFVVVQLDPRLSVDHLDEIAKVEASHVSCQRYVVLITDSVSDYQLRTRQKLTTGSRLACRSSGMQQIDTQWRLYEI